MKCDIHCSRPTSDQRLVSRSHYRSVYLDSLLLPPYIMVSLRGSYLCYV